MAQPIVDTRVAANGDLLLIPRVPLSHQWVQRLWREMRPLLSPQTSQRLALDFRHIQTIDSAGLALLQTLQEYCREHSIQVEFQSVTPTVERFLGFLERGASSAPAVAPAAPPDWVSRLGQWFWLGIKDARDLIDFSGNLTTALVRQFTNLKRFRLRETLYTIQLTGADAMPIVALISFLMGLIMAFQAAVQLRQFGANIFVADLLALAFTRELGPFLTAVILAGRSGSAFAAEIGTMKVNEEIDALTVMGLDITEFLVMPKIYALALAGPLLTFLSDWMGLMGGIVVGVIGLDLTVSGFMQEAYEILSLSDVLTGLLKSFAFSALVASIGCLRGLQTGQGADSVGRQTTSAVVSGIFLIIFADAIFTLLFHIFDW